MESVRLSLVGHLNPAMMTREENHLFDAHFQKIVNDGQTAVCFIAFAEEVSQQRLPQLRSGDMVREARNFFQACTNEPGTDAVGERRHRHDVVRDRAVARL